MKLKLSTSIDNALAIIGELEKGLAGNVYPFMEIDYFAKLMQAKPTSGSSVCWSEILYRSHYSAACALLRAKKWMSGIILAKGANNFYLYISSLRSLLESCADIFYTFEAIAPTLSDPHNFGIIYRIVKRVGVDHMEKEIAEVSKTGSYLEEKLIHFEFADSNKNASQPAHVAKTAKFYIEHLESAFKAQGISLNESLYDCYREFCTIIHPGQASVQYFLTGMQGLKDHEYWYKYDLVKDHNLIYTYEKRFDNLMSQVLATTLNAVLLVFVVLNEYDDAHIYSKAADSLNGKPFNQYRKSMVKKKKGMLKVWTINEASLELTKDAVLGKVKLS